MKTKIFLTAVAAVFLIHSASGQGALTPPGAPAPTMKSLDQIEARTPITNTISLVTISQPGSYYLTGNLTVSTGDGIDITTNGVTLDLNGFTISSTAASAAGYGISLGSVLRNISIANGFIQGSVTNTAAGVFGGSGFGYGIYYSGNIPSNVRVKDVSVAGVLYLGIVLGLGNSTVVEGCTVNVVGNYGIYADSVADSTALNCGSVGIFAGTAHNCKGSGVGNGDGLDATTANNCYGYSNGSGYGLYAATANNCYGYSNGSGYGLEVTAVATGCYGYSYSGTGLYAFIANVCHGDTYLGTAMSVTHNVNSY